MKPVYQQKRHNPPEQFGDCFRACIASVLELELNQVPAFEDIQVPDFWWWSFLGWSIDTHKLHPQAYLFYEDETRKQRKRITLKNVMDACEEGLIPKGYGIMSGKSPRGECDHCVVILNGQVIHDPWQFGEKGDLQDVVDCIFFEAMAKYGDNNS